MAESQSSAPACKGAKPMLHSFRIYRIWRDGSHWRWEVLDRGQLRAYGYERTSAQARAQAMLFAFSIGTAEASG